MRKQELSVNFNFYSSQQQALGYTISHLLSYHSPKFLNEVDHQGNLQKLKMKITLNCHHFQRLVGRIFAALCELVRLADCDEILPIG